jgi:DNA-binding NarL/FixJ family response regulator
LQPDESRYSRAIFEKGPSRAFLVSRSTVACRGEVARTLLAAGVIQRRRRQKRAARELLEEAAAVFDELGATLWADKARAELARVSGRRPQGQELTETERRVATLVADGLANKEVAAALFVTVHTVEAHLSRIYRKLGIRSRRELARVLAAPGEATAEA